MVVPNGASSSPTRTWPPWLHRLANQRTDVDAEAGDHPRRARRLFGEQRPMCGERIGPWRETEGERVGEHQPVDGRFGAHGAGESRAGARETRLVDGIGRMESVANGERQPVAHVRVRVQVGLRRRRFGPCRQLREVDAARIDRRELQQAARRQGLYVRESLGGIVNQRSHANGRRRNRRVDRHIDSGADAFDDARIYLPVEGLRTAAVVGVHVDDARAGLRAVDAVRHDRLDRIGNAGLALAAPRAVQRRFDPGFVHRAGAS